LPYLSLKYIIRSVPDFGNDGETGTVGYPAEVALYIGALSGELGQLARANGLETLGYILDMARMEANEVSKGHDGAEQ
jgi:hypothetical protein